MGHRRWVSSLQQLWWQAVVVWCLQDLGQAHSITESPGQGQGFSDLRQRLERSCWDGGGFGEAELRACPWPQQPREGRSGRGQSAEESREQGGQAAHRGAGKGPQVGCVSGGASQLVCTRVQKAPGYLGPVGAGDGGGYGSGGQCEGPPFACHGRCCPSGLVASPGNDSLGAAACWYTRRRRHGAGLGDDWPSTGRTSSGASNCYDQGLRRGDCGVCPRSTDPSAGRGRPWTFLLRKLSQCCLPGSLSSGCVPLCGRDQPADDATCGTFGWWPLDWPDPAYGCGIHCRGPCIEGQGWCEGSYEDGTQAFFPPFDVFGGQGGPPQCL